MWLRYLGALLLVSLFLFSWASTISLAQEPVNGQGKLPPLEERKKRLAELDLALPEMQDSPMLDGESHKKYNTALRSYYEYRMSGYQHRMKLFQWQFFSSKIIFYTVLFLVLAGVYFAAVQFHSGLRRKTGDEAEETTEFIFTLKGMQVKSPVLGVVILVISLAFFYLYLFFVYPIENVF